MQKFDSIEKIKKIDRSGVYQSLISFPLQCRDAWENAVKVDIPSNYKSFKNVVFCGMGGSGLAARVIESLFLSEMKYPLTRINDYNLPGFVNEDSLVFCSSYSGNTEETVENCRQAIKKGTKWLAIGTGNKLIELAKEKNVPFYLIDPKYNPSNQPRMAVGYSISSQIALAGKLGLVKIEKSDLDGAISKMEDVIQDCGYHVKTGRNKAKSIALKIKKKIVVIVSAQHLVGASHIINNQFNENSKTLTFDFSIPELNHHLMEGLKYPKSNKKNLTVLFMDSNLYSERIEKRFEVTKKVLSKNKISFSSVDISSKDKISQVFELIQFGAFVNFYLSIIYGQDPAPIPWVDYFKEELSKL